MDFLSKIVIHKKWGEGTVCEYNHPYFKIEFKNGIKQFSFPSAFNGFLKFKDEDAQQVIEQMMQEKEEQDAKEKAERMPQLMPSATDAKNTGKAERANVIFKCIFCDGGSDEDHIGYNGICSDDMMHYNIEDAGRSRCSDTTCPCKRYYEGEIDETELEELVSDGGFVCYESKMLRDWTAHAGFSKSGHKRTAEDANKKVQVNSLAVLTTCEPYASEEDRIVFAAFLVDEVEEGREEDHGYVRCHTKYRVQLTPAEAHQVRFWDCYTGEGSHVQPNWSQGLYRYANDAEAVKLLQAIVAVKKDPEGQKAAWELLEKFCKVNKIHL